MLHFGVPWRAASSAVQRTEQWFCVQRRSGRPGCAAGPAAAGEADTTRDKDANEPIDAAAPHQEVGTRSMRAAPPPAAAGGPGGAPAASERVKVSRMSEP